MTTDEPRRVDLTAAAADLLRRLEFQTGEADIMLRGRHVRSILFA
jgi:hypothetical protein